MRYLFFLGHPAHFHLFNNIISELEIRGHETIVLIKTKDVLEQLCIESTLSYTNILPEVRGNSKFGIGISFLFKYKRIGKFIKSFKPDILIGSEPTLAHLGYAFHIPSFVFSEDDVEIIPQFAKIAYPFVSAIISPTTCNAGRWNYKKIGYDGFHKLAYLHPSVFKPDKSKIDFLGVEKYFIIRLTNLQAYHDKGKKGISRNLLLELIVRLEKVGKVFITSERQLPEEFEKYRLVINPLLIHQVLYFADLYIGDSQSMAVEASLLGTPNIRFNDFAAKIGVLNELENKYSLTKGINTSCSDKLLEVVNELVLDSNVVNRTKELAQVMLKDKINVPKFFVWFIENYPQSKQIMKENPDYQYKFK